MTDPGLYARFRRMPDPALPSRPALFLDRDGVLVEEIGYLHRPEDVQLIPAAIQAVVDFNRRHWPVVLVTNQAGVGRGYYDWAAFESVQSVIESAIASAGGWLDGVLACGYHVDGIGALAKDHPWRKPHPGMLLTAADSLRIDLRQSIMVGDKLSDLEAGHAAGVRHNILVRTGYGEESREAVENWQEKLGLENVLCFTSLTELLTFP